MKMSKILSLVLVVVMVLSCFASCGLFGGEQNNNDNNQGGGETPTPETNPLAGTYDITMWVSELPGVAEQFQTQVAAFMAANPSIVINAKIDGVTEADSASKVITDVSTAPDLFCFAQDQLARLVQANALQAPSDAVAERLKAANDSISVSAASVAGSMYAYPLTRDNGYYLYYDTSIISAEEADSLEAIIAACEENGKTFRFALENAWYTASFFFATGCKSNWTTDDSGNFTSVDDTFNSPEGLIAMQGMMKLAKSDCYDGDNNIFTNAGAIVTGIWGANDAVAHYGDNLGATDLPSFEVDGKSYHLGSYSGNKLMGVKPQADSKKGLVLSLLAEFLTNEECQLQRYELKQWGPSNLAAQQNESVKANVSLAALELQTEYAIPQGNIHGSWWDIAKVLGADAKAANGVEDLQAALDSYDATIAPLFQMTEEQKKAWSVIGTVCGTSWNTDLPMTEISAGVFESGVLELKAGEEFKCRQGASWTVNFGANGVKDGDNIVIDADGKYIIRLTVLSETSATIELIAQ